VSPTAVSFSSQNYWKLRTQRPPMFAWGLGTLESEINIPSHPNLTESSIVGLSRLSESRRTRPRVDPLIVRHCLFVCEHKWQHGYALETSRLPNSLGR
jgi:hypothetical protein